MSFSTQDAIKKFQEAESPKNYGLIDDSLIAALKVPTDILVLSRSGKVRARHKCREGESMFLSEVFMPCGATLVQNEGEIGG